MLGFWWCFNGRLSSDSGCSSTCRKAGAELDVWPPLISLDLVSGEVFSTFLQCQWWDRWDRWTLGRPFRSFVWPERNWHLSHFLDFNWLLDTSVIANLPSQRLQTQPLALHSIRHRAVCVYPLRILCEGWHIMWPGSPSPSRVKVCFYHSPIMWRLGLERYAIITFNINLFEDSELPMWLPGASADASVTATRGPPYYPDWVMCNPGFGPKKRPDTGSRDRGVVHNAWGRGHADLAMEGGKMLEGAFI